MLRLTFILSRCNTKFDIWQSPIKYSIGGQQSVSVTFKSKYKLAYHQHLKINCHRFGPWAYCGHQGSLHAPDISRKLQLNDVGAYSDVANGEKQTQRYSVLCL